MNNETASFNADKAFSATQQRHFDAYYQSQPFKALLRKLRLKGSVDVTRIDRSENPLFQIETHLDAIITLSCGSALKIDEKSRRYESWSKYDSSDWPVEVVSNPNRNGKHDGWGYHNGTTMVCGRLNQLRNGFNEPPLVFNVTHKFIDEITRNDDYRLCFNKKTGGLYASAFRLVPRSVLEEYWP